MSYLHKIQFKKASFVSRQFFIELLNYIYHNLGGIKVDNRFVSIIKIPDHIRIKTENSPFRFEEADTPYTPDARVEFIVTDRSLRVILMPSSEKVQWIRLRFRGNMRHIISVLGDTLERAVDTHLQWKSFHPHELLGWYFHAYDGRYLHSYGVKTGGNSFAYWQCDPSGITLLLDVRNGSGGVMPKEPLECAEIVCSRSKEDQTPFEAAQDFCKLMCDTPKLPSMPVYGFNNWYWAYGNTDQNTLIREAVYLKELCQDLSTPFVVMDDGWQAARAPKYNGGPWDCCNNHFSSMEETAAQIQNAGCYPGLWMRPLLTCIDVPGEATYYRNQTDNSLVMDPSHPWTLERVATDIARIHNWGYKLIKHDFTTWDLFDGASEDERPLHFYDQEKTNAQIIKNLYQTIQNAAGDSLIIGCNTINHLTAGIHQMQRIGGDTSGRSFEWTRRYGIHSMMRMPQNSRFFQADPDCAAFTGMVSPSLNLDFMEAMAITGATVWASVTPGILTASQENRMHDIFKLASSLRLEESAAILDWHRTSIPSEFLFRNQEKHYDWYREYEGARQFLDWLQ